MKVLFLTEFEYILPLHYKILTMQENIPSSNTEQEIDLVELVKKLWKQRKAIFKFAGCSVVIGIIVAFSIPREYETRVIMALENNNSSSDQVNGLANLAGINLGSGEIGGITSQIYPDIVKSTPFLLEFADIRVTDKEGNEFAFADYLNEEIKSPWWGAVFKLPGTIIGWIAGKKDEGEGEEKDIRNLPKKYRDFIKALTERLGASEDKKTGLLTLSATMQDPYVAALIADSMFCKLQKYMIVYQTGKTKEDLNISIKLYEEAKEKYYRAEDSLAKALDQNQNVISFKLRVKLDRLENERNLAYNIYNQTAQQVENNKMKLQNATPIATIIEPAQVPVIPASPKKTLIVIAFLFLGVFVKSGMILFRDFFPIEPKPEPDQSES